MRRRRTNRMTMIYSKAIVTAFVLFVSGMASAQSLAVDAGSTVPITADLDTGRGGWQQIYNLAELRLFAIDVVVALVLAFAIASHPARRAARTKTLDFIMPRLFAFYALIGMVVGFLVDQHGYIIGFVIFGIGALLRFRSNLDDPIDTVEMILVTVLGLCVGLNLPIMAILIGVISWILIWLAARNIPIELRLQAEDAEKLETALQQVRQITKRERWREAFIHHSHSKNSVRLILLHPSDMGEEAIEAALSSELTGDGLTWRLSR